MCSSDLIQSFTSYFSLFSIGNELSAEEFDLWIKRLMNSNLGQDFVENLDQSEHFAKKYFSGLINNEYMYNSSLAWNMTEIFLVRTLSGI